MISPHALGLGLKGQFLGLVTRKLSYITTKATTYLRKTLALKYSCAFYVSENNAFVDYGIAFFDFFFNVECKIIMNTWRLLISS